MTGLLRLAGAIDRAGTLVAGAALCVLTVLIVADVTMRYLANAPLAFTHDLISLYLTPLVFFLGVGPTYHHDEHLAVDLLTARMSARARVWSGIAGAVMGLVMFALLTWVAGARAWASLVADERIASLIPWPAWASHAIVPVGGAMMCVVCLARIVSLAGGAQSPSDARPDAHAAGGVE